MMQAYNNTTLYNKYVREQALEAFHREGISAETHEKIIQAHPLNLYTPNYFIRIAIGLLTIVAVLFSTLLLWLISGASGDNAFVVLFILSAVIWYIALELFVSSKKYYNAGVDNVLMCFTIIYLLSAFLINEFTNSYIITSGFMLLFCFWLCIRFTDAFMAILSYCSLLILAFFICIKMGDFGKTVIPFILMIISAVVYFIMKGSLNNQRLSFYDFCLRSVLFFALLTFYASGNYFIVKELGNKIFHPSAPGDTIPLGWFFWIFTMIVPLVYLTRGILKKDILFIRTGLGLLAATIFTIKYYYSIFPTEIEMLVIGIVVIAISYVLIRYLRTSRHGFSFEKDAYNKNNLSNAEALIIAQTFGKKTSDSTGFEFGGGAGEGPPREHGYLGVLEDPDREDRRKHHDIPVQGSLSRPPRGTALERACVRDAVRRARMLRRRHPPVEEPPARIYRRRDLLHAVYPDHLGHIPPLPRPQAAVRRWLRRGPPGTTSEVRNSFWPLQGSDYMGQGGRKQASRGCPYRNHVAARSLFRFGLALRRGLGTGRKRLRHQLFGLTHAPARHPDLEAQRRQLGSRGQQRRNAIGVQHAADHVGLHLAGNRAAGQRDHVQRMCIEDDIFTSILRHAFRISQNKLEEPFFHA
jgi:hypothetical protein